MPHPYFISPFNALPDWIEQLNFTHFVTLTLNQKGFYRPDHILEYARDKIKFFHAQLDRCFLGSRWASKSIEERTLFIAFPEKIATNMHYHLFMQIKAKHENSFYANAESIWLNIIPSGTFDCKRLDTAPNPRGLFLYATKEQFKTVNFNNTIISSEFLNI